MRWYRVADHIDALQRHTFPTIVDHVVSNDTPRELGPLFLGEPVVSDGRVPQHATLEEADLTDPSHPVRHDSEKLARTVMAVYHRESRIRAPLRLALRS